MHELSLVTRQPLLVSSLPYYNSQEGSTLSPMTQAFHSCKARIKLTPSSGQDFMGMDQLRLA